MFYMSEKITCTFNDATIWLKYQSINQSINQSIALWIIVDQNSRLWCYNALHVEWQNKPNIYEWNIEIYLKYYKVKQMFNGYG